MRTIPKPWPALLTAVVLSACSSMPSGSAETPPLAGTAWVLSTLRGQAPMDGPTLTLRFEDGQAQGSDGCNRYSTPYAATGSALGITARGATTMMACPPELMRQAADYMAALNGARRYRVTGGQLQLLGSDGGTLATFAAQDTALPGTAWRVTAYNNGRQAVVGVLAGTALTLRFAADGRAAGSAGCNSYSTRYEGDVVRLRFGQAATTRKMCAGNGVMAQEQAFLKALSTVAMGRIEGNRLELRTVEGALAATLLRERADD